MKNLLKLFGIIALVAVIGFSFVACGNGTTDGDDDDYVIKRFPDNLQGTWKGTNEYTLIINQFGIEFDSWSYSLHSIEGNTYTCVLLNGVITLVFGTDGKVTVSSNTHDEWNGVYTKETT